MVKMDRTEEKKTLNRREALKTIAAASGALGAAAFLPGKWSKPLVEVGVLPAHAQSTVDLLISNLETQPLSGPAAPNQPRFPYFAQFDYSDPLGQVNGNAKLYANATGFCNENYWKGDPLNSSGIKLTGTPYNGSVWFNFNASVTCVNGSQLNVQLGAGGRMSNILSDDIPPPFS
jgi:hypothetical protein